MSQNTSLQIFKDSIGFIALGLIFICSVQSVQAQSSSEIISLPSPTPQSTPQPSTSPQPITTPVPVIITEISQTTSQPTLTPQPSEQPESEENSRSDNIFFLGNEDNRTPPLENDSPVDFIVSESNQDYYQPSSEVGNFANSIDNPVLIKTEVTPLADDLYSKVIVAPAQFVFKADPKNFYSEDGMNSSIKYSLYLISSVSIFFGAIILKPDAFYFLMFWRGRKSQPATPLDFFNKRVRLLRH